MIGKEIGNHRILKELGRGGMGVVYKANQLSLGRLVAMKVLPQHLTSDPAFIKRFENEARAIAKLNHPNIVQIHDISHQDELYYYTMEFIEGVPLDEIIYKEGFLPVERAINIIVQVAKALQYAHSQGIVHRDIKPSNIMIDKLSRIKVTDFGLALQERTTRLTMDGGIVGTPEYMSPEQAAGQTATPRSDIYSLGVVFYELLTGKVPFEADSPLMLINKIQNSEPEWPRSINADIPLEIEKVIQTMMAKNTRDRYASCQEVIQDLRRVKTGQPIAARPKRRYSVGLAAAVGALVLATAAGGGLFFLKHSKNGYPEAPSQTPATEPQKTAQPAPVLAPEPEPVSEPESALAANTAERPVSPAEQRISQIDKELAVVGDELKSISLQKPPPEEMWPDEITLKTGSKKRCDIISESPEKVRIRTDTAVAEIPRSEITLITPATAEEKESARAVRASEEKRLEDEHRIRNRIESLRKERARLAETLEREKAPNEAPPNAKAAALPPPPGPHPPPALAETATGTANQMAAQSPAQTKKGTIQIPLVEENWTATHDCQRHADILFDNDAISIASDHRIGRSTCTTTLSTISPIEGIPDTIRMAVEVHRIMTPRTDRALFFLVVNFASGSSIEYSLFDSRFSAATPEVVQIDHGIRITRPELLVLPKKSWRAIVLPLGADIARIKGGERIRNLAPVCRYAGPTAGTTMFRCKAIALTWK